MPSHAVRSLLCDFRVGENRRHSRGLGGRAAVSGQQIPKFPVWTSGFVAPVSAHHFPISVSARPRPVRYLTETGLQSCVSSVAVTRDVGMKSATSRVSAISALGGSRCHLIAPAFAGPPTPDGRKPGRIRVVPLIADRFKAAGLTTGVVWSCGRVGLSMCPLPFVMPVALRLASAGMGNCPTCTWVHSLPRAVRIPRLFNTSAMAFRLLAPAFWISRSSGSRFAPN
jgi:hypothetical protein